MNMTLFWKIEEYLYFQKFSVYKAVNVFYFTRTSNKRPSMNISELERNLLKGLKKGGSYVKMGFFILRLKP